MVRAAALALAAAAEVPADHLREARFDRSAANRRLAATALGLRGDTGARHPLCDDLARFPSTELIEATSVIWDDDPIVHLGRCARPTGVAPTRRQPLADRTARAAAWLVARAFMPATTALPAGPRPTPASSSSRRFAFDMSFRSRRSSSRPPRPDRGSHPSRPSPSPCGDGAA